MSETSGPPAPRPGGARARLIRSAIELIAARGYRRATVAEICASADLSSEDFYELFGSKEECFLAAFDESVEEALARVKHACQADPGFPPRIGSALGSLVEYLVEEPEVARACVIEPMEAGPNAIRHRDLLLARFARLLEKAQRRGRFRAEPNPLVAEAAVGGVFHVISHRVRGEGPASLAPLVPELARTIGLLLGREDLLG